MTVMVAEPSTGPMRFIDVARRRHETVRPYAASPARVPRATAEERMRMVYKAHAGALLGTLLRWTCGDRPAAEDLLQETMLRAWRNLDTLNPDTAALRSWLMTVARRIAIDALRARTARPPETAADPLERVAVSGEPFEQYVNRQVIRDALAGLSAEHRAALTHVYFLDQTVPQAARQLGVPEGTVKSRLHYALRAVRAAIEAVGLGRGLSTVDA